MISVSRVDVPKRFRRGDETVLALLVGVLGVTNTMVVAVLEQRREIGVLRAVGATRRQIRRTVLIEAAAIGASGALLGLAGGAALAAMTLVVSESTTGWVLPYVYEWRRRSRPRSWPSPRRSPRAGGPRGAPRGRRPPQRWRASETFQKRTLS